MARQHTRRLGIMGGTFDPIHYGHLRMAEEARQAFDLEKIVFVTNGNPAHKKAYLVTDAELRLTMVARAIASNPNFECSRVEIDRAGPSYAVDTVLQFRLMYPNLESLYFITGADAILEILSWHDWRRLVDECEFIAANRPGFPLERLQSVITEDVLARVHLLTIPGLDISSTDIRRRIQEGRSIRYLTPETVEESIRVEGLYGGAPTME